MTRNTQSSRPRNRYPAWALSFADLMTLLLTFFIAMFSVSKMDAQRYEQLAASLAMTTASVDMPSAEQAQPALSDELDIKTVLEEEIGDGLIELEENAGGIIIRMQEQIAFQSATDELDPGFVPVLEKIGRTIAVMPGRITVSGHTDDLPIETPRFRSNWDLATARAVSVVHRLLAVRGIDPARLTAAGRADAAPLVANDSPEHRALNRRVEIRLDLPAQR